MNQSQPITENNARACGAPISDPARLSIVQQHAGPEAGAPTSAHASTHKKAATLPLLALLTALLLGGCGQTGRTGSDPHEAKAKAGEHAEEPSGASFRPGKGVLLTPETLKIIGLLVVDATEQKLPHKLQFTVQVYGAIENAKASGDRRQLRATGVVPARDAALVKAGAEIQINSNAGGSGVATVTKVHAGISSEEAELELLVTSDQFKPGEFLTATLALSREEMVTVIPHSALLRTCEGAFVYAVNGSAYYRTAVKVGATGESVIEIKDGLLAGDQVVTTPVETLWLIELRATKGGRGCCH